MDYVYIGKIVNTHGIKGEVRILSSFEHKDKVFKPEFNIYIGDKKEHQIINSYRFHKIFDMITFQGINDINDVLKYKGSKIYINRLDLDSNTILNQDYIGMDCYTDKYIGKVKSIIKNKNQEIIVIDKDGKEILIPKVDEFIKKIDLKNKKIYINNIKGLIYED